MAIKRITTNLIKDSDIATVDIANNAITAAKITDGNITTAKLADLNVTAGKLAATLDLTGKTITVATATTGDSDTSPASTAFVQQEIAALVDSSPSSLNTLNELAAALGDDASFSTTVTNSIATKLPLAGGTMTGDLKVGATIASTGGTTNNRGMLLAHQNNTNQSYVGRSENGVADTGNRITFDYDNDKMQLDSDGDIVLTPTSNVGISTTSPDFTLDVEADKDTWISRIYNTGSDANAQALLVRSDATAAHDATVMGVYTDGGYKMVVRSTGNVGIGTTSPLSKLHVYSAAATSTPKDSYAVALFDDTEGRIQVRATNSGSDGAVVGLSTGSHNWGLMATAANTFSNAFAIGYADTSTDGNVFGVSSMSEKLIITTSGNVGINEISPDYKLHISGSGSAAQMQIESTSNSNAQLIFRNTTSAGSGSTGGFHIGLLGDTSGDGLIYHHHDKPIRFYTNAANTMTLTGEDGMLHLNGRSGAYGYAVPQDQGLGYTNNLNAGAFGILHRNSYDSYITGNTYYYKTGGSSSWRAKYGAYKSTVIGMVNGAISFDCSTTAPGSNGAATVGLANIVQINSDGISMAAGKGISFSANSNASGMTSELLDDYEEGTFTPTFSGATLSQAVGTYTKIGNLVTVSYRIVTTGGLPSSGTQVQIGGLPFTISNATINSVALGFGGAGSVYVGPSNVSSATGGGGTIVSFASGGEAFLRFVNVDTGTFGYTLMGELEVSANNVITAIGTHTYQV